MSSIDPTTTDVDNNENVVAHVIEEQTEEAISDATAETKVEIPEKDYTQLSQEQLLAELKSLVSKYPVQLLKEQIELIREEFNLKFDAAAAKSKEEFLEEGGNEIDFYYSTPLKKDFNKAYFDYKGKRNKYYQDVQTNLENNLKNRLQLIEELKLVISNEDSVGKKFEAFNEIKEKWNNAGNIPRDDKNVVWNTYYHHVDKFYEVVHLNREFRELDYKHNLEQKFKILERAKELTQETNINRAFRELQVLHKIWKEEIGPVAREFKEEVWNKFSKLSNEIHDKRKEYFAAQDAQQVKNLEVKKEVISKLYALVETLRTSHNQWQNAIKQVKSLFEQFQSAGRVPLEFKNSIWDDYRAAERAFNAKKNEFYKEAKTEQLDNLNKKKALIEIAEANKDSDDIESTTQLMKKIQSDWKKIGHVPKKDSDKVWKQFKEACNYFFDRINSLKEEANKVQEEAFEKKTAFIDSLKDTVVEDFETIKSKINEWKTLGTVPFSKRKIEDQFSSILDSMFEKLNLNKKEAELMKFQSKLDEIVAADNPRLINDERNFIRKKMDEVKSEIIQLENNLQFFKHADRKNPMVADVYKKIDRNNEQLEIWKAKWNKIKSL